MTTKTALAVIMTICGLGLIAGSAVVTGCNFEFFAVGFLALATLPLIFAN
jgi:hypothetical protein